MNAKDKDNILLQIAQHVPHTQIDGLNECLHELEKDGLVKCTYDEQHNPITIDLTVDGGEFIRRGGFYANQVRKTKARIVAILKWLLAGVALAAIGELVKIALSQMR